MKLVFFLTIATIFSITLGEFGRFPFGGSSSSISLMDILLTVTLVFLVIWQIGIKKKIQINKSFGLLIVFWITGFISLIFSGNFSGVDYLIRFIVYSSAFYLGSSLVGEDVKNYDVLFESVIWLGVILSVLGLIQLVVYPDLLELTVYGYDPHKNRLVSTFLDPNFLGSFLIIPLLFCYQKIKLNKIRYGSIFAVILISIILTFSRTAYFMLAVSLLIQGIINGRKMIFIFLISVVALYFLFAPFKARVEGAFRIDKSAGERFGSWQKGISIFQSSPITGVGFNNLRDVSNERGDLKVYSENGGHAGAGVDSSLLFVLATTGIVGISVYLLWLGYVITKFLSIIKAEKKEKFLLPIIIITALLIGSQFINSLFFPPIMLIFFLFLGMSLTFLQLKNK